MSIQQQNQIDSLRVEIDEIKGGLSALRDQVVELTKLLQAMTRASSGKDKAA